MNATNNIFDDSKCYIDLVKDGEIIATFTLLHRKQMAAFMKYRGLGKENMRFGVLGL